MSGIVAEISFKPGQPRFGIEEIADTFAQLMTEVLGYRRFAAQGGDWGAFISSRLGYRYPERLAGIHLNLLAIRRDPKEKEVITQYPMGPLNDLGLLKMDFLGLRTLTVLHDAEEPNIVEGGGRAREPHRGVQRERGDEHDVSHVRVVACAP